MSRVLCGCSVLIEVIQDGKDNWYAGECGICQRNEGRYDRSPHWKELQPIDQTTLDKVREKFQKEEKDAKRADKTVQGVQDGSSARRDSRRRK